MRTVRAGAVILALALVLPACGTTDDEAVTRTASTGADVDPAAAARAEVTYIVECVDDLYVQEPRQLTLACADGNEYLDGLTWTGWGQDEASATGKVVTQDCDPTCAEGAEITYPVAVTVSGLVLGEASATYRHLSVRATGEHPDWVRAEETYELPGLTPGEGPEVMVE